MNLFKKNDRKDSTQNSNNNPKQGNTMNASSEMKPIDPVKPVLNLVKPEINSVKQNGGDMEQKNGAISPKSEQASEGNKQ